jgi:8-oxo-dGTP pyrophosphatase MutT (NUDIX family)
MTKAPADRFHDPALLGVPEAEEFFGFPVRSISPEPVPDPGPGIRHPFGRKRKAEIVFVLPRPAGLLVHAKAFYPAGLLRLPSGGLRAGETVLEGARRELKEETGLVLEPRRFLFHLIQEARHGAGFRRFHSLGFLYPAGSQTVVPSDPREQITEFTTVPWERLPEIIARLENMDPSWRAWGRFRAAPHRALLEARAQHPEWFEE